MCHFFVTSAPGWHTLGARSRGRGGCRAQFCRPEVGGDALVRQLFAEFFPDLADYEETAWVGVARGYSTHSFISNSIFRLSFELPSKIPK